MPTTRNRYTSNLVLKINAKLGGINHALVEMLPKFEQPTIVFGVHLQHRGARSTPVSPNG
eukprot:COSAG01_NODE_6244_length_3770_cov_36.061530_3_plen_60_part_00